MKNDVNKNVDTKKPRGNGLNKLHSQIQNISDDTNLKGLQFMQHIAPPINYDRHDPEQMRTQLEKYIQACADFGVKAGNMQCYFALGIDHRDTTKLIAKNDAISDIIKTAQYFCRSMREFYSQSGELNPVLSIFWAKNYDGLQDRTDINVNSVTIDEIPTEKLIETVKDLPKIDNL